MVSDDAGNGLQKVTIVLILVVMEYGLRQTESVSFQTSVVLILVVMEYGLRLQIDSYFLC